MKTATEISRGDESAFLELNSGAAAIGAELGKLGTTTTAGCWSRTTQQFALTALPVSDAGTQQLCAVLCVDCAHVANGVSIAPISATATAARSKMRDFMKRVYHSCRFSW
jgi:hypothetical protein